MCNSPSINNYYPMHCIDCIASPHARSSPIDKKRLDGVLFHSNNIASSSSRPKRPSSSFSTTLSSFATWPVTSAYA